MNKTLFEMLSQITVVQLVTALILIITVATIITSQIKKMFKLLNRWRNKKNDEEDFNSLVYHLKDSVAEINNTIEEVSQNRMHDREDSRRIRAEMYAVMDKQSENIENLTKIVIDMQKKNSKTKRAEIKEKIERIYSECHPAMTCTDMQFETLKELIEEYEEHGGNNSFVHSTVEPEMHSWRKINRIKKVNNIYD